MSRRNRFARVAIPILMIGLLAGCATRDPAVSTAPPTRQAAEPAPAPSAAQAAPIEVTFADDDPILALLDHAPLEPLSPAPIAELDTDPPEISEARAEEERALVKDEPATFDIPIVLNDEVLRWLDYYSRKRHASFAPGLARGGRYVDMFRRIFAEHGLPQDLVYMAHVESAYKTSAYSRAHAKGVFQFISSTGRRYGLRIDWYVDERSDPEKAANAAAEYLKDLYEEFGDWYLALASYNGGEGRMRRSLRHSGETDFFAMTRRRYFRRETRNYVPAILAATLISKEPEKYGFDVTYDDPVTYESFQVRGPVDLRVLAKCAGTDLDTMKLLNPALRRMQTPPDGATDVRVPVGTAATAQAALEKIPAKDRILYARHKVRRGDTLGALARNYGVSVSSIQAANRMGRSTMIREGRVLMIPTSSAATYGYLATQSNAGANGTVTHTVQRGDTLYGIARAYGTTPKAIAAASGIPVNDILHAGDRLTVHPGKRAYASGSSRTYTVRRGDSLWRIANRHNTTVDKLCRANRLTRNSTIHPGTKLVIP